MVKSYISVFTPSLIFFFHIFSFFFFFGLITASWKAMEFPPHLNTSISRHPHHIILPLVRHLCTANEQSLSIGFSSHLSAMSCYCMRSACSCWGWY